LNKNTICFVLPGWVTKQTGGAEWQCYLLSEELIKRGWSVEVVTWGTGKNNYSKSKYYNHKIKYHYYQTRPLLVIGLFRVLFVLMKTKSKVYYNRTDARLLRAACIIYCTIFNKKTVYALAGDDEVQISKYLDANLPRKNYALNIIRTIDSRLIDFIVEKAMNHLGIVLSQTEYQRKLFKQNTDLESFVVNSSFKIEENELTKDFNKQNIILWVGNFRYVKNPAALEIILSTLILDNWRLVIVGRINEYNHLLKYENDNIIFLKEIPFSDTYNWFEKAKILINTSKREGFPNTFIQAWLNNVWVLSLNVDPDKIISEKGFGDYFKNDLGKMIFKLQNYIDGDIISGAKLCEAKLFSVSKYDLRKNVNKIEHLLTNSI